MKKRILYVPLDERPCNYDFPYELVRDTDFELIRPELYIMGAKKSPADIDKIWEWLEKEAEAADGAILSIDTLLYGGILPSRLHRLTVEQCKNRLNRIAGLKRINPSIKLYGFHLIMRCPAYSSSDEEPDYYEEWGKEIFLQGSLRHRSELGIASEEERDSLMEIEGRLPQQFFEDYIARRKVNLEANFYSLDLAGTAGIVDFLVIPQDDSSPYGLTAQDQQKVRNRILELSLQGDVYMYPGADEAGCTLLARMINAFTGTMPLIYADFSSVQGPSIIPLYEDRQLYETLKYHVMAAGGLLCSSLSDANMTMCLNTPGRRMREAASQFEADPEDDRNRNPVELAEKVAYSIHRLGKPCIVADVAFANGADLQLLHLLRRKELLFDLAGYAAWNTNGNTLGTCIAQGMIYNLFGRTRTHLEFLALRYVEDAGYCSHVRSLVATTRLPENCDYFRTDGQRGIVADIVRSELQRFIRERLEYGTYKIGIDDCRMPWSRMFEVGLRISVQIAEHDN